MRPIARGSAFHSLRLFLRENSEQRWYRIFMPSVRKDRGLYYFLGVIMMGIQEDAVRFHQQGCNCAQSVLAACGKYTGLEQNTALSVAAGFGGGVRSGEICGAISGAVMAIGLVEPDKRKVAAMTKQCVDSFRQEFGCVRCLELKQNRVSCDALIEYGAKYIEELMKQKD